MNKKVVLFLFGLLAALILVNIYLMQRNIDTGSTSQLAETAQSGASDTAIPHLQPGKKASTTNPMAAKHTSVKTSRQTDKKHDTSWQKPAYQPTEEEQARAAIMATLSPEEQRQAQADLYQMSLYYRSAEEVDEAIAAAQKNGNEKLLDRLKRFRLLAYPDD